VLSKNIHLTYDVALHHAQTVLGGERLYIRICHLWGMAGNGFGPASWPGNAPGLTLSKLNALDPVYSKHVRKYGGIKWL
jgi:hypothetical protein